MEILFLLIAAITITSIIHQNAITNNHRQVVSYLQDIASQTRTSGRMVGHAILIADNIAKRQVSQRAKDMMLRSRRTIHKKRYKKKNMQVPKLYFK